MKNPYADPDNWRAVFYGEDPPNENLTHGNLVTLNGTGQIIFEYIGPNGEDEYIPVLFSPLYGVVVGEFKDPHSPRFDEIKGPTQQLAEAEFIIAYNKNNASFRILKSRKSWGKDNLNDLIENA